MVIVVASHTPMSLSDLGLSLHAILQAPMDVVVARVNISDSSRGAVFPPGLRFTPQDWAHPKA